MADPRHSSEQQGGFTLVELVIVMVLIGALVAVSAVFIVQPFQATEDLERRAALVDAADLALDRMTREARRALPNSVRVHDAGHVEFILVRTAGRYRRLPPQGGGGGGRFVPAQPSGTFEVMGGLIDADRVETRGAGTDCANGTGDCLSVYNTGQEDFNAYAGNNIAAVTDVGADSVSYDTDGSAPAFEAHSPEQRFYIFETVVSYICEGNELRRYSDYGLQSSAPDPDNGALVASNVADCDFRYTQGTAQRRGLLTLRLDLTRAGESVFLLDQAQVANAP